MEPDGKGAFRYYEYNRKSTDPTRHLVSATSSSTIGHLLIYLVSGLGTE